MERNVQRIGYAVNRFRGNLLLIRGGTDPEEIRDEFAEVERILREVYVDIMNETPDPGLEGIHRKILEAAGTYVEAVEEFMKFYDEHDDDHFVYSGLKINEANELLNQAAAMF